MCQGILAIKSPGRKTKPSRPSPRQVLGNLGLPRKLYLLKALFMNHCNGIMLMRSTVVHQLVALKMRILSSTKPTKHSASVHRGRGSSHSFHPVAKGWGGIKVITWVRHSTTLNGCWRQKQQKKRGLAGAACHKWRAVCAQVYLQVGQTPHPCPWCNREGGSCSAMLVLCHELPPGSLRKNRWGLFLPDHCHLGDSCG